MGRGFHIRILFVLYCLNVFLPEPVSAHRLCNTLLTEIAGQHKIGVIGLGPTGETLIRATLQDSTIAIIAYDRRPSKVYKFVSDRGPSGNLTGAFTLNELVEMLPAPRTLVMAVPARIENVPQADGTKKTILPPDEMIAKLWLLLKPDDTIIDATDSLEEDTVRRRTFLEAKGVHFITAQDSLVTSQPN